MNTSTIEADAPTVEATAPEHDYDALAIRAIEKFAKEAGVDLAANPPTDAIHAIFVKRVKHEIEYHHASEDAAVDEAACQAFLAYLMGDFK